MARFGRSEKEKEQMKQQRIKDEMEWRKGHLMCKNNHTVDTMWVSVGEKCKSCGEVLMPFSNTIIYHKYTGIVADKYREDKLL